MRILLIDNEDSFTRNLEHLLAVETGEAPEIVPYARFRPHQIAHAALVVISPGPGHPDEYPAYAPLFAPQAEVVPILGVCLGMQIINRALGGEVARLGGCVHGRAEEVDFHGQRVRVARYHSLYCSRLAPDLELVAENDDGVPMAVRHRHLPITGYQFHPESFLTDQGNRFIRHALHSHHTA